MQTLKMKSGMMKLAQVIYMINILIAMDVNAKNVRSFSTNDEETKRSRSTLQYLSKRQNLNSKRNISTNNLSKKYAIESKESDIFTGSDYKRRVQANRIVRGQIAPKGRYKYIVSLTHKNGQHFCGGSLIAPDIVLSAAHCAKGIEGGFAEVSRYDKSDHEEGYESFRISEIIFHPQYSRPKYDYILVKLSGKSSAPLIALNGDSNIPSSSSDSLTVMGWGATGEGESGVNKLREVELKYVTNEVCEASEGAYINWDWKTKEWITKYDSYNGRIDKYEMCASDIDDEGHAEDSCYGDSGGPLIIKGNNQFEDIQVGIVSWGFQCGSVNFPGVYARVSHEIEWIKQTTCDVSSFNPQKYNPLSFSCDSEPTLSPTLAPTITQEHLEFITFQIQLDEYPEEVGWELFEVTSGGDILKEESPIGTYKDRHNEFVTDRIVVTPGKSYKFSISDSYGDGVTVFGPNTFLYQGPKEGGKLIHSWRGNWGRHQEITFDVPDLVVPSYTNSPTLEPTKNVQFDKRHQVTLKIKLDDHPEHISWEIRSKNGSVLFASSGEQKYTTKGVVITEEILLDPGRNYKLIVKDLGKNGISVKGPNIILYEGKVGVGRIIFRDWANWGAATEKIFWLHDFPIESRLIDQTCSRNFECKSGYCKWGRCKSRPTECADSTDKFYLDSENGMQFCSFVVTRKEKYCSWQRMKDRCPVTCGACDDKFN